MTDFVLKEGQALIYKVKADGKKPVVKGKAMYGGQEFELSFWPAKSGKDGSYTGKIQTPFKKSENHKGFNSQGDVARDDMNDEIPF